MKLFLLSLIFLTFLTGCQNNDSKAYPYMSRQSGTIDLVHEKGVNPNSLAYKANDKAKDRENKIELSKIDAQTKIKLEKIKSENSLKIAQLNAQTKKEIAKGDTLTRLETSKLDILKQKESDKMNLYITLATLLVVLIALYLFYLNNKNKRKLEDKINQERLRHERELKEREHQEQRLHKMIDLAVDGKLPPEMQNEIILSISNNSTKAIEAKTK